MSLFSPVEHLCLQLLQRICCPTLVRVLLIVLGLFLLNWFWQRTVSAETPRRSGPTLYDPGRLRDVLATFTLPPTSTHLSERHRTEALCRQMLEAMLGISLPKCRPKWLLNPTTKRCLELDMYSAEHGLAFEYDGAQHDVYTPHYHANPDHFAYRQLLDRLKTELCREHGVLLIRIPWMHVSWRDQVRTAQFLERLLYTHGLPYTALSGIGPAVVTATADQPDRSRPERRFPWPPSPGAGLRGRSSASAPPRSAEAT